ncbi:MAG TPA: hypothetical protein VE449_06085 [Thermoleophilaceae bacterium]|nr:hypothetical protein [Thermoleophilaceae bacterium]
MPAIAEHVCQSCGKVTWSEVPTRTDTMPACQCGGRRQIVRIRHKPAHPHDAASRLAVERARE